MLLSISRAATRRLVSTNVATSFARSLVFGAATKPHFSAPGIYGASTYAIRGYAAAARPKKAATSGRAKTTAAKKPAKKSTSKTTKAKAKPKPKSKSKVKAKPKAKAKAKSKSTRAKRPVSDERKRQLERRSLTKLAMYKEPKAQPTGAWLLYVAESVRNRPAGTPLTDQMAQVARDFKALPASELERLKKTSEQNKLVNAAAYKAWVESHPVQAIYDANVARRALKKKYNFPKRTLKLIRDDRMPKRPPTSFLLFTKARWASGDYASEAGPSAAAKIGAEWGVLSAAERKPYNDLARSQIEQYKKETSGLIRRKKPKSSKSPSPSR